MSREWRALVTLVKGSISTREAISFLCILYSVTLERGLDYKMAKNLTNLKSSVDWNLLSSKQKLSKSLYKQTKTMWRILAGRIEKHVTYELFDCPAATWAKNKYFVKKKVDVDIVHECKFI
jgi:hypothetical protein